MVVLTVEIYPRKAGYFGNSLMLKHYAWILEPHPICPAIRKNQAIPSKPQLVISSIYSVGMVEIEG